MAYHQVLNAHPPFERILAIDWAKDGFSATIKTVLIVNEVLIALLSDHTQLKVTAVV